MQFESIFRKVWPYLKDVLLISSIVGSIFIILFLYSGIWPPIVVVESGSMQHGDNSDIGMIDTGDIVLINSISDRSEIKTYIDGKAEDYKTYGDYGNVIIYERNYGAPIIHRAMIYLEWNGHWVASSLSNLNDEDWSSQTNDYNNLGSWLVLDNVGYKDITLNISLNSIIHEDGYITMGDHNSPVWDNEIISFSRVVGKAEGELPWFGLIKLYITGTVPDDVPSNSINSLIASVISIVVVVFVTDYVKEKYFPEFSLKEKVFSILHIRKEKQEEDHNKEV